MSFPVLLVWLLTLIIQLHVRNEAHKKTSGLFSDDHLNMLLASLAMFFTYHGEIGNSGN